MGFKETPPPPSGNGGVVSAISVARRGPPEAHVPEFARPLRWRSPGGR